MAGCQSIRGNYREKNQDRIVCLIARIRGQKNFGLACVCDGIGSFEKSELAAKMVTDGVASWYEGKKENYMQCTAEELLMDLEGTLEELNELLCEYQQKAQVRIGCTMSLLMFLGAEYYIFHVGDSRIYSVRNEMYQLTNDEVQQVSKDGRLKAYLANYMGKTENLWMNRGKGILSRGEIIALGTDGFFNQLMFEDFDEFRGKMKSDKDMDSISEKLLNRVLERGEQDNISCILLKLGKERILSKREYRRLP